MKTWTERLPGIIAFIESGNGIAKAKAKKELERMAITADRYEINKKCKHCEFLYQTFGEIEQLNPREYWLFTEIFVYLHGSDECKE